MPRRTSTKFFSLSVAALVLMATVTLISPSSAGALQPPWVQQIITTHQEPHVICRANGGSISPNQEADQDLGFTVSYPDAVAQGQTFSIKIRPDVSLYPRDDRSTGVTATINNIYNQVSSYQMPAGAVINNVTLGPANGNVEANAEAGYYVDRANVPHSVISGVGDVPNENFNPMTLAASQRLAIPGIAPNAYWNTTTNRVYTTLLGTGSGGSTQEYRGGSALQGPTVTINMTATTALLGDDLQVKLGGQLPGSEPRNYTGAQPGNFSPPASAAALSGTPAAAPWGSTNGTRYTWSDTVWTDPSYLNTVHTTAIIITVTAKAACAPGYETTDDFPTPPSYYTGPNAIPNGTSPALTHTAVTEAVDTRAPVVTITSPVDGGKYVLEQAPVNASFDCNDPYGSGDKICDGTVDNGEAVDWTEGPHTFDVYAEDNLGNNTTKQVTYTVAPNSNPVANHGPNQINKKTGDTVMLDASGSTDPDTPPAQTLSYLWEQTGGVPVTLSSATAQKPTFVVSAAPDFVYPHAITFKVTVSDPYGGTDTTADSVSIGVVATTPTITAINKARAGGGTNFTVGDLTTLSATVTNPDGGALTYAWSQASGRTTSLSATNVATPTFTIPSSGAAPTTNACTSGTTATGPAVANCPRFQATVTATQTGAGTSAAVALAAYAANLPTRPVANSGTAQTIASAGGTVTLDGSASTQAQGHTISYAWTQTGGPAVTLSSNTAQKPTFTAPTGGGATTTYTFSLTVVDTQSPITGTGTNGNTSTAATTTVTQVPNAVVANAGPNQTGKVAGNLITLDASASTEPNLQPLTYQWTQVANGAPTVTLSDATAQKPTFTAPPATTSTGYVAQFNVTATNGGPNAGDTDTSDTPVSITVAASTPTVVQTQSRAGGGTTFFVGDTMTLNAAITNPDGNNPADYTYLWTQTSGRTTTLSSNTVANPTFIMPSSGANQTGAACTSGTGTTGPTQANCPKWSVVVTKINTTKASTATLLAAYAASLPTRPVANAGTAQTVKVGTTVTLDGSASAQAQGHPFTYAWTQTAGTAVTLTGANTATPSFTAPNTPTAATFSLTITDTNSPLTAPAANQRVSAASTVNVTVSNYASPVAVAAADPSSLNVGGGTVTLDGSGSSQADNHNLTYHWTQSQGTPVTLSDADVVSPTFSAPNAGTTLKFTVTVTDAQNPNPAVASTTSAAVTVNVNDYAAPVANQGTNQSVNVGTHNVQLSGTASQADNHALTYLWTQTSGTPVTLSDATILNPTFNAPNAGTTLRFKLTVTDTENPNPVVGVVTTSEVTVGVGEFAPPVANPGVQQTKYRRDVVALDASGSSQADNHTLTYHWEQTSGVSVTLSDANSAQPTFTAPETPGSLKFKVTVTDTQNPNPAYNTAVSDEVQVDVQDYTAPEANAGPNQTNIDIGTTVTLDGSGSFQLEGHEVTYQWTQVDNGAPTVTLSDATAQKPTFIAPIGPATLQFELVVDDTFNHSAPDTVFIDVNGIAGLDFASNLEGKVDGTKAASSFLINVVNDGTLTRTITAGTLSASIKKNNVAVPASEYAITAKSVTLASHKYTNFVLKWTHGTTSINAGDIIEIKTCVNVLGDSNPSNNCSVKLDPPGDVRVFAWPAADLAISAKAPTSSFHVWLTNVSSFAVGPIRVAQNVTATVRVNGTGPVYTAVPSARAPFILGAPYARTSGFTFNWSHAPIQKGDFVEVTACAVVPNNTHIPACFSKTVRATK